MSLVALGTGRGIGKLADGYRFASCMGENARGREDRVGDKSMAMKGFISYAHDDHQLFDGFATHLKSVRRAFDLELWFDHEIYAGARWDSSIASAIGVAQVFVLLISPNFIGSDYVFEKEIPAIQAQRLAVGALVLPVVLKRCTWQLIAAALQAVPTENGRVRPVSDWRPWEHGYDRATGQIITAIERHFGLTRKAISW
jgi:hypothetical protein